VPLAASPALVGLDNRNQPVASLRRTASPESASRALNPLREAAHSRLESGAGPARAPARPGVASQKEHYRDRFAEWATLRLDTV